MALSSTVVGAPAFCSIIASGSLLALALSRQMVHSLNLARSSKVIRSLSMNLSFPWLIHAHWYARMVMIHSSMLAPSRGMIRSASDDTLRDVGSLIQRGTLRHSGSLLKPVTFKHYGSLPLSGTLICVGSLAQCGTLFDSDSFHGFGTLTCLIHSYIMALSVAMVHTVCTPRNSP
jgi:hypothetical protein